MTDQTSIDDCYFYYYSSCTKGELCPFRHCEAALGTETVCSLWKEGRCFKSNCKFRHMESRINRTKIPCYWENQPGGCRKPHCVFFHRKLKNGVSSGKENSGLILPVSNGPQHSVSPKAPEEDELNPSPRSSPRLDIHSEFVPDSTSVPVAPIVVSFDEESDNESVSSTPMKISTDSVGSDQAGLAKSNLLSKFSGDSEKKDFGVKTLEQIKMEKIHKESEHFYKSDDLLGNGIPKLGLKSNRNDPIFCYSDYDPPALNAPQKAKKIASECYPPQSEFISLSTPAETASDKSLFATTKEPSPQNLEKESFLRSRLSMRNSFSSIKASDKRVINFKKQNNKSEVTSDSLNFKIKTLDEIRRERENKQGNKEDNSNSPDNTSNNSAEESRILNQGQKPTRRLKITRKPTEVYSQHNINTKGGGDSVQSNSSMETETQSQMVVHKVANEKIQPEDSIGVRTTVTITQGKRKVSEDNEQITKNKLVKRDTEFTNKSLVSNGVTADEKPAAKDWPKLLGLMPVKSSTSSKPVSAVKNAFMVSSDPTEGRNDTSPGAGEAVMETSNEDFSISSTTEDNRTEVQSGEEYKSLFVDEFDNFVMGEGMNMEEQIDAGSTEGDDILLEIEQFLDS